MTNHRNKMRRIFALAVAGIAALLAFAMMPSAHAVTYGEIPYQHGSWCATVVSNYPAGSGKASPHNPIVLGSCANAYTQRFYAYCSPSYECELVSDLVNGATGHNLCVTFYGVSGASPDGIPVILGDCAGATTQEVFQDIGYYSSDETWAAISLYDNNGHNFALNLKNGVKANGQPFNGSYDGEGLLTEDVRGPNPCFMYPTCRP